MKRILFISNYKPGTGGISGQVEILGRLLAQEGYVTSVFNARGSIWYRVKSFFKLLKEGRDYDVFHIHGCSNWGFFPIVLGVVVGRKLNKRLVVTYHGGGADGFFECHARFVRRYLLKVDVNIVLSGFLSDIFSRYEIPHRVVPNVIALEDGIFRQRDVIHPHYISIRSHTPLYNIECIIRAFAEVKNNIPEARLTILGDGPSRKDLEAMVADLGLVDVSFVGRVDNKDVYRYLDKDDILLSAPRVDNMPISLLEAFNAGLLVISSRVGGVPYMIEEGVNGMMFESDDSKQLADKMIQAVAEQDATKMMIRNAYGTLSRYSWSEVRKDLLMAYYETDAISTSSSLQG